MASQYYTPLSNGLQSFVDASPEYEFADVGIGSFREQASRLAEFGRNGDIYVVHAAEGETVIPTEVLDANPKVRELLFEQMRGMGLDPQEYVVGNELNSRNPVTGMPEFFFSSVFRSVKKAAKNVWKFAKKVAPVVLPIAAAMFGVPFLGPMFGAGTFGASFLGSGIGSLIGGASVKDSIKSGLMAGATTAAFQGLSGAFSDTGTLAGGIKGSLTGKTPVFNTFGEQIGTQVAASPYAESKYAFNVGGYRPEVISAGQEASTAQWDKFSTGNIFGAAKTGTPFDSASGTMDAPGFLDAPGFGANASLEPRLPKVAASYSDKPFPKLTAAPADNRLRMAKAAPLRLRPTDVNYMGPPRPLEESYYGFESSYGTPAYMETPGGEFAMMPFGMDIEGVPGGPSPDLGGWDPSSSKPWAGQWDTPSVKVSLDGGGGDFPIGHEANDQLVDLTLPERTYPEKGWDWLTAGGDRPEVWAQRGEDAFTKSMSDAAAQGVSPKDAYRAALAAKAAAMDPGYLKTYGPTVLGGIAAWYALSDEEKEQRLASLDEERNKRNRLLQENQADYVVSDLDTGQFSSSAPSDLILPSAYPFRPAPRRRQVMFGNQGGLAQYPRREMLVEGPGTERSDDIPAMLSDGEFVLNARSVRGADPTGQGNRHRGAQNLYSMMRDFEMRAST